MARNPTTYEISLQLLNECRSSLYPDRLRVRMSGWKPDLQPCGCPDLLRSYGSVRWDRVQLHRELMNAAFFGPPDHLWLANKLLCP